MKLLTLFIFVAAWVACVVAGPVAHAQARAPGDLIKAYNVSNSSIQTSSSGFDGTIVVQIESERQNVGDLRGSFMYGWIYDTLKIICNAPQLHGCAIGTARQLSRYGINGLNKQGDWNLGALSFDVTVKHYQFGKNNKNREMAYLMIGTVAKVLEEASNNDKNCYYYRDQRLCNVANRVTVHVPDGYGSTLDVSIKESFHMGTVKFNCLDVRKPTNTYLNTLMPQYQRAAGKTFNWNVYCGLHTDTASAAIEGRTAMDIAVRSTDISLDSSDAAVDGTLSVAIGTIQQQTGTLRGSDLYGVIYKTLEDLCPRYNSAIFECLHESAKITVYGIKSSKKMGHIYVTITVKEGRWGRSGDMRRLMIGTVAGVLEEASMQQSSCESKGQDGQLWFCNVPDFVQIVVPGGKGRMEVRISSEKVFAHYDCWGVVGHADNMVHALLPEYRQDTGMSMDQHVYCGRTLTRSALARAITKRSTNTSLETSDDDTAETAHCRFPGQPCGIQTLSDV